MFRFLKLSGVKVKSALGKCMPDTDAGQEKILCRTPNMITMSKAHNSDIGQFLSSVMIVYLRPSVPLPLPP